jgi:chromosome partitioning protein
MHIVAIANQKGGTGKTTGAVNLTAALTRKGRTVLAVDLDPQASLTEYFLSREQMEALTDTMLPLLVDARPIEPLQLGPSIGLLPSTIDLAAAEIQLPSKRGSERALARMLRHYHTDYCIIDCPPSLGILTTNALSAARRVLIPVTPELMSIRTVPLILNTIADVRETELNMDVQAWRILCSMYDSRLGHHKDGLESLQRNYPTLLYREPIKATTRYKDSASERSDVSELDAAQGEYWDRLASALVEEMEESHASAEA